MGRILHLSDLHFGAHRPELIEALVQQAQRVAPDITVISGDLTQRARTTEWQLARALLAALPGPVLVVPGNHDVPLYNPLARLFWPFHRYRQAISAQLEPVVECEDLLVVGLNTTDPLAWQRGLARPRALAQMQARLGAARPGQLRVAVLHHPLITPEATGKTPMKGAARAGEALVAAGADLVLTGHLHLWAADPYAIRQGGRAFLCVQAGTTLSTRVRGEDNDFNVIDFEDGVISVTRWYTSGESLRFRPEAAQLFDLGSDETGWIRRLVAQV